MTKEAIIQCESLAKTFVDGVAKVEILQAINLTVYRGELVAVVGASGSGKSTLLHCIGALDRPTKGHVLVDGINIHKKNEKEQGDIRNKYLGFVYQFHHLLPEFTALENVAMPLLIRGDSRKLAYQKAEAIVEQVGLSHRIKHKPGELSGGERQRIALARALVTEPACVLADEPTGNLDPHTAESTYELMLNLNQQLKTTFIIVTHDPSLADRMDRKLLMQDGQLVDFN